MRKSCGLEARATRQQIPREGDTPRFARIPREQGKLTPEQSTSLVEALGGVLAADIATRTDIAGVEASQHEVQLRLEVGIAAAERPLEAKIIESRHRLEARVAEIRGDLANVKADLKWMSSTVGLQTVVILGAVVALARVLH